LAEAIMAAGILPPQAVRDSAHVANAQIARRIARVCEKLGHRMPIICTPEELMGG
jgi:hypothetical protein